MSVDALIILSGVLVTLIPFLGFPLRIDNIILMVLGVGIMMLGIIVRRRNQRRLRRAARTETYVESVPRDLEAHAE